MHSRTTSQRCRRRTFASRISSSSFCRKSPRRANKTKWESPTWPWCEILGADILPDILRIFFSSDFRAEPPGTRALQSKHNGGTDGSLESYARLSHQQLQQNTPSAHCFSCALFRCILPTFHCSFQPRTGLALLSNDQRFRYDPSPSNISDHIDPLRTMANRFYSHQISAHFHVSSQLAEPTELFAAYFSARSPCPRLADLFCCSHRFCGSRRCCHLVLQSVFRAANRPRNPLRQTRSSSAPAPV